MNELTKQLAKAAQANGICTSWLNELKTLDYKARNWHFIEVVPEDIFDKVIFNLDAIIGK